MTPGFSFKEIARDGNARCGRFVTPRAHIDTPAFMPVGTKATVKGLTPDEVASTGAKIVLANTYHLWLRPGPELMERWGIHRFMAWPHAVLTDSGGYQIFSLAELRKIEEEGVTFRSHLDGSLKHLSPEEAMRVQTCIGSDIAMVLDVCPPAEASRATIEEAVQRTTRWAERCLRAPRREGQSRFGIVQGGCELDLRLSHLQTVASMPFDGLALGGFSVGEPAEKMNAVLAELGPKMPTTKPRYLMGVGTPQNLLQAIGFGIDLFDCVLPTRNGRNGQALTWNGRVNLRQAKHKDDESPLDIQCDCTTCTRFSRAYLRHLFNAGEMLGPRLITLHNLHFYGALMKKARGMIVENNYEKWSTEVLAQFHQGDEVASP